MFKSIISGAANRTRSINTSTDPLPRIRLGMAVVHHDTDSTHMHVAINKIHPTRFTIHDPHRDFHILAKACEELEKAFHLREDNHAKTGKTEGERKAGDMEAMAILTIS